MQRGDIAQLKVPCTGRRFQGKIIKIDKNEITVALDNGFTATYPTEDWELVKERKEN